MPCLLCMAARQRSDVSSCGPLGAGPRCGVSPGCCWWSGCPDQTSGAVAVPLWSALITEHSKTKNKTNKQQQQQKQCRPWTRFSALCTVASHVHLCSSCCYLPSSHFVNVLALHWLTISVSMGLHDGVIRPALGC